MTISEKFLFLKENGLSIKFLSSLCGIKTSLMYKWSSNNQELSPEKKIVIENTIEKLYDLYLTNEKAKESIHYEDLTNQKFNHLTALYPVGATKSGSMQWACQCDCGNPILKITSSMSLKNGDTASCGCQRYGKTPLNFKDLTGKKFGKLKVLSRGPNTNTDNRVQWLCECECGNQVLIRSTSLIKNKTISCGCFSQSIGELKIETLLRENSIEYKKEFSFNDLVSPKGKKLRFDFAIFNNGQLDYLIEFDGSQHTDNKLHFNETQEEKEYRKICDNLKDIYCKKNNIKLLRIPYFKKEKLTIKDLLVV